MRVLCARLLPALAGVAAVAGLVALGPGPSPAAASPAPATAATAALAPTPPVPTPPAPAPGKPSPPAVPAGKPVPAPPGTDPCESINGIPASNACSGVGKNHSANDKCQVENFHNCNKPITGQAQGTWQKDQNTHAQTQQDFHAVRRDQSVASGTAELCHSSSGMRDRLTDAHVIVPPSDWWAC
ncbi:hypothetical protein [Streptomyces sp. NPDC050804]|uniref:hypothetical protein n=1 Tax=Streptomyces sp. NPDC050804 TaxID=3154745 RepID=UPI003428081B